MIQNEKIYFLKNLELALLLSVKGMTKLYGIKMNGIHMIDKSSVYQTLFELEKKRLITLHDKKIVICPKLDDMLDNVKNANEMVLYRNRATEYPDQCIYLGEKAVFISSYGRAQGMNRIESVSIGSLPEKIQEYGFRAEEMISDRSLFEEREIKDAELEKRARYLFGSENSQPGDNRWEGIANYLNVITLNGMKCVRQYLILNEIINDYFIRTDEQTSRIFAYSEEKVLDVLRADFVENN